MRILRFDSVGGASGDMILGALIDLGADTAAISAKLKTLGIENFSLNASPCTDDGFKGTRLKVDIADEHHPHRNLADITALIQKGRLSDRVRSDSIAIFQRLAEAEAKVHNTTIDKIHFHEVGAMDSIIDIVGSCIALELLKIDGIVVGPLPLGHGTVECAHGVIPVPVPATVELLQNHPVIQTTEPFELVTPTGAAILTTLDKPGRMTNIRHDSDPDFDYDMEVLEEQEFTVFSVAYGYGHRKLKSRPNIIRITLLEACNSTLSPVSADLCVVLETNIDDTIPELIGSLTGRLLKLGALDVYTTPVSMKKQRPGTLLTVICRPEDKVVMMDAIFTGSTTFGIREHIAQRTCLNRHIIDVTTPYGKVRVKVGSWQGRDITRSPEYEDCQKNAEEHNVPVRTVYEAAIQALS